MTNLSLALIVVSFGLIISSCGRRLNNATTSSKDVAMVEGGFNELQKITEDVIKENEPGSLFDIIYGSGAELTVTPPWPST